MDENNKNFILAITLSIAVLFIWQFFYAGPQHEEQLKRQKERAEVVKAQQGVKQPNNLPADKGVANIKAPVLSPTAVKDRKKVLNATKRVDIDTPSLKGSIALKGARIDDLVLKKYRETVKKDSKNIVLLSPSGSEKPYYAEYGWVASQGAKLELPNAETVWTLAGGSKLTDKSPITLQYDNGQGLVFKREISVDDNYMFTVRQSVENKTDKEITLYPYALISRHGTPKLENFFILHEGLLGVLGEDSLVEVDYSEAVEDGRLSYAKREYKYQQTGGWLGITDKYWATAIIPDQKAKYHANMSGPKELFQADYRLNGVTVAPGTTADVKGHLFAGAKQTHLIENYESSLNILKFNLMIDWGWFWFLTKPLFHALDYFFKMFGNYGVSILVVTVLIKLIMFPLANKSYESMSKMKQLQPEMQRLRERFKDDKMRQQQELMELYKKEKINPMAGCLPVFVQIPVFFALYKVLFVTIDTRHAPFFGWIQDLSAPDPTNLFNLFGLIPIDPPFPFQVGIWAIIMGITMWVQMKLNPQQGDPVQQAVFNWMPVLFTFMLATFPAGLVIYWAWNNLLSVIQQWYIMAKNGVEVNLFENMGLDKLWNFYKSYTGTNKT